MTIVYHVETLQPMSGCIGYDETPMSADTVGIYTTEGAAHAAVVRYWTARSLECEGMDPQAEWGEECVIHKVQLDKDLIYPQGAAI